MTSEGQVQESEQEASGAPEPPPAPGSAPVPGAETPAQPEAQAPPETPAQPEAQAPPETPAQPEVQAKPKPRGKGRGRRERDRGRGRRPKVPDVPRSRAALPLDELRDASRATLELFGRAGIRDAFQILAPRERQDISALIAQDEDHRPRARNIANGSLGAGRIDKAMSATIISMAPREDLWAITLDKEQAAAKLGRVRAAKQRDQQRAERQKARENRADRVSKEDLEKATDGTVGATIRIVSDDDRRERRKKGEEPEAPQQKPSVLDRLGY